LRTPILELSSLCSSRYAGEYWNDGIMGDLVLSNVKEGKRDNCLLAKVLLAGKLINEKLLLKSTFSPRRRLYEPEANIPPFHVQGKNSKLKKSF